VSLFSRLRGLQRIQRIESDLDEELRSHLEMRAEHNRASGMSPDQARYDARRRFGNVSLVKEDARDADMLRWIEILMQNLRYAARTLRRNPGFTLVAIVTLALGIGANVATFSVVHAVLFNPLPFTHPEQLVRVLDDLRGSSTQDVGMSVPELWDLRDKSAIFQDISVAWPVDANLTGGEHPDRVEFLGTDTNYFTLLGQQPQLGRVYTVVDSVPGFTEGIVISDGFWHRAFGADRNILGRKIRLDGDLYSILGVLPPSFHHPGQSVGGTEIEVFAAAGFAANPFPNPPVRGFRILPGAIARLKPGLTIAQAQARLDAFTAQLSREFPTEYPPAANWGLRLVQVQDDLVGKVRTELLVLLGGVGCVLLIGCVNLANLLLARSAARQREVALRQSLGATRGRVIAQMLTESFLLSSISGVLALLLVVVLKASLLRLAPSNLPRLSEVTINPNVLLFAFLISIGTGVIFGLAPALQTVRSQATNLREGSRGSGTSKHQLRISRTLVVSEIALSLVLLIGAGLLLRSFWHLIEVRPGFDPHSVVTAKIWLAVPNVPDNDPYRTPEKRAAFHQEVLRRVSSIPGVETAAVGNGTGLPMSGQHFQLPFNVESRAEASERTPVAEITSVSPGYFGLLRIPLIAGRAFTDADDSKGQQVVIVNQTLARKYWPNGEAVGQHIQFVTQRGDGTRAPWVTIIGVVADTKSDGLDLATEPRVFRPLYQAPTYDGVVFVRTRVDTGTVGDTVRNQVQSVDPTIPVFGVRSMEGVLAEYMEQRRFALQLLGIFAAVALLLASVGIYGVMAYTFSRRTNEIGIRMAIGAQRLDILKIALAEAAWTIAFGLVIGFVGSLFLTRFLQSMLFEVRPSDPVTLFAISALLAGVALLACYVPAHRASRVDPLLALRHE
jgi:putative ABC transport system permease protein